MISAYQSALSGLNAFATRLHSNSNNVANVNTDGFKKTRVVNASVDPQGVKTTVEKVDTPGALTSRESSTGQDVVELSNVDLAEELPAMTSNSHFYKANLQTIKTVDEMMGSLLDAKG